MINGKRIFELDQIENIPADAVLEIDQTATSSSKKVSFQNFKNAVKIDALSEVIEKTSQAIAAAETATTKANQAEEDANRAQISAEEAALSASKVKIFPGQIITSLLPQNDNGLVLLNGQVVSSEGIYKNFIDTSLRPLAEDEQFSNLFCDEETWQSIVTAKDQCAKFVIDDTNHTVRVPLINKFLEGVLSLADLGDVMEAGLPSIAHTHKIPMSEYGAANGIQQPILHINEGAPAVSSRTNSSVSSIYGKSSTVQPASAKVLYYLVFIAASSPTPGTITASDVINEPYGNITADNVQNAINQLNDLIEGPIITSLKITENRFIIKKTDAGGGEEKILVMKAGTAIRINNNGNPKQLVFNADTEFDAELILDTGSWQNGKDYCIYAIYNSTLDETGLAVSLNSTYPEGYTAENSRKIGGFHTLCADVGTGLSYEQGGLIFDHSLNGYVAGDILPASIWCLTFRPYSTPNGMVFCDKTDSWIDIYLQSGTGFSTGSVYNGTIIHSRLPQDLIEDLFCVNKKFLSAFEFSAAMEGSNQRSSKNGAFPFPNAGGHTDDHSRRMISNIGCEEGCGLYWQYLSDIAAVSGGFWVATASSKGDFLGTTHVLSAGGNFYDDYHAGSRAWINDFKLNDSDITRSSRGRSHNVRGGI